MTTRRRKFDRAFKLKAVELSHQRENIQELAAELGIRVDMLYRWRRKFASEGAAGFPGNGKVALSAEQERIARLEKELREVRLERDILKKAVAIPACRQAGSPRATGNLLIYKRAPPSVSR